MDSSPTRHPFERRSAPVPVAMSRRRGRLTIRRTAPDHRSDDPWVSGTPVRFVARTRPMLQRHPQDEVVRSPPLFDEDIDAPCARCWTSRPLNRPGSKVEPQRYGAPPDSPIPATPASIASTTRRGYYDRASLQPAGDRLPIPRDAPSRERPSSKRFRQGILSKRLARRIHFGGPPIGHVRLQRSTSTGDSRDRQYGRWSSELADGAHSGRS